MSESTDVSKRKQYLVFNFGMHVDQFFEKKKNAMAIF